jgi:hypothetical protein
MKGLVFSSKDSGLNKPQSLGFYHRGNRKIALCSLCLCGEIVDSKVLRDTKGTEKLLCVLCASVVRL